MTAGIKEKQLVANTQVVVVPAAPVSKDQLQQRLSCSCVYGDPELFALAYGYKPAFGRPLCLLTPMSLNASVI
jgi:hypothetical protein